MQYEEFNPELTKHKAPYPANVVPVGAEPIVIYPSGWWDAQMYPPTPVEVR